MWAGSALGALRDNLSLPSQLSLPGSLAFVPWLTDASLQSPCPPSWVFPRLLPTRTSRRMSSGRDDICKDPLPDIAFTVWTDTSSEEATPDPRAPARAGGEPSGTCVHVEGGLSPERGSLRTDHTGVSGPTCKISLCTIFLCSHLGPLYKNKKKALTQAYRSAEKQRRVESYSVSLPPRVFISNCLRSLPTEDVK